MEKEEDCKKSNKKPMVVKLNSEQLNDFIKRYPNTGKFFSLTYLIHDENGHF